MLKQRRHLVKLLKSTWTAALLCGLAVVVLLAGSRFGLFTSARAAAEQDGSPDALWQDVAEAAIVNAQPGRRVAQAEQQSRLRAYRTVRLNQERLGELLRQAPMEFTDAAKTAATIMTLPLPDGTFARFRIEEAPMMEPDLAALHPEIKSYRGRGLDDPTATARFGISSEGFHAQVLSAHGAIYVDTYLPGEREYYISYNKQDYASADDGFRCGTPNGSLAERTAPTRINAAEVVSGDTLHIYRLALAATGQYTNVFRQSGDTDAQARNRVFAMMMRTMTRVNGIFEHEISVSLTLTRNDAIIFTDPLTDPYPDRRDGNGNLVNDTDTNAPSDPDDLTVMGRQNQTTLDRVIRSENYDIGHVFGTGSGGNAGDIGTVCGAVKGAAFTARRDPTGDPFDVDFVAHEMGHQFGANHTWNAAGSAATTGSCSVGGRAGADRPARGRAAYEPGSGSTIMSYAGICNSADLQPHSDDYFHTRSLEQIIDFIGTTCTHTIMRSGNHPPTVNAGLDKTIPQQTPFTLTVAEYRDPDTGGSDVVVTPSFCWEQYSLGAASPPDDDDGARPIFRSRPPVNSLSRTFPDPQYILNDPEGNDFNVPPVRNAAGFLVGESLPTRARSGDNARFRVTARDNQGGIATDEMRVNITTTSGPFVVTEPNTPAFWPVGSTQTVTWGVANTNNAPVNCRNVNILLSTDGGQTFPFVLAENTPNDGSQAITVPNRLTTQARIKVEAVGNIFFDISNNNFEIVGADLTLTKAGMPDPVVTGPATRLTYTIRVTNQGPADATSVVLTDVLPTTTNFVSCQATNGGVCEGAGNNSRVTFASLPVGTTATVTLLVNANCSLVDGATIRNTAHVESLTVGDPDPSNNSATVSTKASNPPPVISNAAVDKPLLSPDDQLKRVTVNYVATDNCEPPPPACSLSVTIGEELNPAVMRPPGDDAVVLDRHTVLLRAEPDHDCPRFYDIAITCRDNVGATSVQKVRVKVPRPRT
ncbi:MAG: DUF11 domain-containing protein [Acidobacteria bacterium]|nr:DUF11 domain-containing protein [Acidobacteriota bacterium]